MRRTRWTTILALCLVPGILTWAVLNLVLRHQGHVPALTIWGGAVAVVVAVAVLVAGWAVRRLRAHKSTWITPTGAAATAAAAQASALVGAVIAGVYGGELVLAWLAPASAAMSSLGHSALACLIAAVFWCGSGILVEHWCALSADDDDSDPHSGSSALPNDGAAA